MCDRLRVCRCPFTNTNSISMRRIVRHDKRIQRFLFLFLLLLFMLDQLYRVCVWWYLLAQCWSLSLKMNPYIDMLRVPTINIHCTDILHNTELYMAWTIPLLIKVNYMFLFAWCFQWYYLHLIDQFPLLLLLIIQFLLLILLLFFFSLYHY